MSQYVGNRAVCRLPGRRLAGVDDGRQLQVQHAGVGQRLPDLCRSPAACGEPGAPRFVGAVEETPVNRADARER